MKELPEWMKDVTLNDFDEKNREIAEIIGIENLLLMMKYFGGIRIYFNKLGECCIPLRNSKIRQEFTGYNLTELSRKYNMSLEGIRKITKEDIKCYQKKKKKLFN